MREAIRAFIVEVFPVESEKRMEVVNAIRHYRAVCRKVFGLLVAVEAAGSDFTEIDGAFRVMPNTDRSKTILENALGKSGKAHLYEMRDWVLKELAPTWRSIVFDCMRRDISSKWRARDPAHPEARRDYLTLNGARKLAEFNHSPLPILHSKSHNAAVNFDGHKVILEWDKRMGAIAFQVAKLEPARWWYWRNLAGNKWRFGTALLNERDGNLRLTIPYYRPIEDEITLNAGRRFTVKIGGCPDHYFTGTGLDISILSTLRWLERLSAQRSECRRRRASVSRGRSLNFEARLAGRLSAARENGSRTWNHTWAKKIVSACRIQKAGSLGLGSLPPDLHGHPWWWSQFKSILQYKCEAAGIEVLGG